MSIADKIKFDEHGLVTAIIQDEKTKDVLMVAYVNREALAKTFETGLMHFWSRSRKKLWLKGESSGHVQKVRDIFIDCDGDAILITVEQKGGACHVGYRSCFYRKLNTKSDTLETVGVKVFEPEKVYKEKSQS